MTRGTRDGTLSYQGDTATITFERHLAHPIDRVWAALTEPAQRGRWFGATSLEARRGGVIDMVSEGPPSPPEARRMTGRILVWEPPHVFEHEWNQSITGSTVVRYELRVEGTGTRQLFTHSGMKPAHAKGFIPGEHAFLDRLEAHLGQAPLPVWTERYAQVQGTYA